MPATATTSMLATIKGMHYYIRTAHGISPSFYTSTAATLILGVLQGSGAAPCIWLSLSCILLQAIHSHTTQVPSLMSQKYPHFPTPRRGLCRQHQPVAHRAFPLHLRTNLSIFYAKSCASMGAPTIPQRGCLGASEMLILPSPVEMDSPWISPFK